MDFFSEQDRARRRSGLLVACFLVAVLAIILAIYVVVIIAFYYTQEEPAQMLWWHPGLFAGTAAAILLIIGLGSLGRTASLSAGGPAVAEMVGGRLVSPDTQDSEERRLLNIVEEMALASGTAVPPVYMLEEEGINAFAAGYRSDDAVIGVTRGALRQLSRDEMQGVIAHEFSHILHGDMRLNIRLMGILYGILMISILGSLMMRVLWFSGGRSRRRSSSSDGKGQGVLIAIFLAGLALYIIGYLGVFFGSLIKAAVSRQREYLADASAVQYTRNPQGIGGALKKLAGFHSRVSHPGAAEASHFFFGSASRLSSLLATHPPLTDRIARIDPAFTAQSSQQSHKDVGFAQAGAQGFAGSTAVRASKQEQIVAQVGDPLAEHLHASRSLLQSLPEALCTASHDPWSARALIHCLLLHQQESLRQAQYTALEQQVDAQVFAQIKGLAPLVAPLNRRQRFALVDLCMPVLLQLSASQRRDFLAMVELLIQADAQVSVYEYVLRHRLRLALDLGFLRSVSGSATVRDVHTLLCVVAGVGNQNSERAMAAYQAAAAEISLSGLSYACMQDWSQLDKALLRLARARPRVKRNLLKALSLAVAEDGVITSDEGELLRAIAISLDCPLPPLLAPASDA